MCIIVISQTDRARDKENVHETIRNIRAEIINTKLLIEVDNLICGHRGSTSGSYGR